MIESNDEDSADYLKRYYDIDGSDPMQYHLLINTGKMGLDQAARLIVEAAQELEGVPAAVDPVIADY